MIEQWRNVPRYEGRYQVSSFGAVRRVGGKMLKPSYYRGYARVSLGNKQRTVHRIVAEAFIGPLLPGIKVNHKDGNKGNNRIENLEYMTRREEEKRCK